MANRKQVIPEMLSPNVIDLANNKTYQYKDYIYTLSGQDYYCTIFGNSIEEIEKILNNEH